MKTFYNLLKITIIFYSLIYLQTFCWNLSFSAHVDTITPIQPITDYGNNSTILVSANRTFELGFFSPGKSKNRYLGIWFKATPHVVVWIANRNTPLNNGSNAKLTIGQKGNLVLLNQLSNEIIWFSNSSSAPNKPVARLLDSGNLVLKEKDSMNDEGQYAWQSFDYPTDTFLAGMKLGRDLNTGLERYLTSWKSIDDPSAGSTTYRMNLSGLPQAILSVGTTRKYRTGTWNGVQFSGFKTPPGTAFELVNVFDENEAYMTFETAVNSMISILRVNDSRMERLTLPYGSSEWTTMYTIPSDTIPCAAYGYCGPNALCLTDGFASCECLRGFEPTSYVGWAALNWSKGCKRKTRLDCQKGEGFVKVVDVKLPDLLEYWLNKNMSLQECEEACLKDCSCVAYANSDVRSGGSGCLMWFGDLIDMKKIYVKGVEQDFYVRLSASEMKSISDANRMKRLKLILLLALVPCMLTFSVVILRVTRKLRKSGKVGKNKVEDIELPIFDLSTIVTATKNFAEENMVGEGGFGLVYKGNLSTGQEIAVKRLSENSGQGSNEFKNEVELIAKLQHRNLVALLGCCVEGEERMLIYEYMPNKSLDHFVFESKRSIILPWEKIFDIVKGIARGLLYLHQDSKLQIVHRDLKASNILLDNNLNPKISDFGLARILRDDEKQAKTRKVIGTYGYMSPEYAIDGNFSVKSDVFSFGVLLLETVSGKKNRNFNHPDHQHNLLGHAWLLWNENKAIELMDLSFKDSCVESQVLRCTQVGLLCVQKSPSNRPTMSSVVFMLENEEAVLPQPKGQPGFFAERGTVSSDEFSKSRTADSYSQNEVSVTMPSGR